MLGYVAIYSTIGSGWFRNSDATSQQRRSIFGILPHEIAALNERSAARPPKVRKAPSAQPRLSDVRHALTDAPG